MSKTCFFLHITGSSQTSTGSQEESPGAGQGSPGDSHLPPESMPPVGPGPRLSQSICCNSSLVPGAFFCATPPPPPPCLPSPVSHRKDTNERPLAWKSLSLSHQKEGLVSALPRSFFHSSRVPVPSLVLRWPLSRAPLSKQTHGLLWGFSLFSAAFQGFLLVSAYLAVTPLPLSATSSSAPCRCSPHPHPSGCVRVSVRTHLLGHLIQSYGFKRLLHADLSKICISSHDLSPPAPVSHFRPAT